MMPRRSPLGYARLLAVVSAIALGAAAGYAADRTVIETEIPPLPDSVSGASYRPPQPNAGAENHLDVCYLPDRLAGTWEDRWVTMNIHIPPEGGPYPCLIFIHGGGYNGGDKDFGLKGAGPGSSMAMRQHAIREGYVAVNLNYILTYGGNVSPAVFYDFRAAVRFLRANAKRFRIDPGRIAAWGFSAGAWLCSSAGLSEIDEVLGKGDGKTPGDLPEPELADFNSRLSCMIVDLWKYKERVRPHSPPVLTLMGKGGTPNFTGQTAGGRVDVLTFLDPKYAGKGGLHIPSVTSVVAALDGGGESTYEDQAFWWLNRELKGANRRTVPPEARPNVRIFGERVEVRLVPASTDAVIHYTTDGSDPTTSSPVYLVPFSITRDTVVKALARRNGEQPSPVVATTFTRGKAPPRIVAPGMVKLPPATLGKPYSVRFACAEGDRPVIWNMTGHLAPGGPLSTKNWKAGDPGLALDAKSGVLAGAPRRTGTFTINVQARHEAGEWPGVRTYVLTVRPGEGGSATDADMTKPKP